MKTVNKILALALIALFGLSSTTYAAKYGVKEKAVAKATQVVENGAPDDWKLLASQADYLIRKDAGLTTAKEWIEASLSIKEDTYNLEIMGDYYSKCNLHKKAIAYYVKSIDKKKEEEGLEANISSIQNKIMAAKAVM